MPTSAAQRSWEAENNVITIDPSQNALYALPSHADYQKFLNDAPWRKDPNYFTHVRVSALALLKMAIHARSGGSIEVMGLMTGYVSGTSFIITDAFRLPVEGTETRVNAQTEAEGYMVEYGELSRGGGGQQENPLGWYHSHPGYGCWLSGIDVGTQKQWQMNLDPFVAVVIDPDRTVSAGKVEIGAFRTYPEGYKPARSGLDDDGFQSIPTAKIEDFGAYASSYYSLEVTHFKSTLDTSLLSLLWDKYWTSTLSQSPLFTNRDYVYSQISDHAVKIQEAARRVKGTHSMRGRGPSELVDGAGEDKNFKIKNDSNLEAVVKASNKINSEAYAGLMANDVKKQLFWNVVQETKVRIASEAATQAAAGSGAVPARSTT